jgi:hypothetical protein
VKLRKEHAVIIFILLAFIVFFINVVIVLGNKNAKIHDLEKENDKLRTLHEALMRDHEDLRKEKVRIMKKFNETVKQSNGKPSESNSPDNQ